MIKNHLSDEGQEGEYALVIHKDGEDLYKYEQSIPWDDPEWEHKESFEHGRVPLLDMEEVRVEQHTNSSGGLKLVIIRTPSMKRVDTEPDPDEDDNTSNDEGERTQNDSDYVTYFRGHDRIGGGNDQPAKNQSENMKEAVRYLINEHGLLNEIDLPHGLPGTGQVTINTEPYHPNGDEMHLYKEINGVYVFTHMDKKYKKKRIEDLANQVGLEVEFHGDW